MFDAMRGRSAASGEGHVDEPFLVIVSCRSGETRDPECDGGLRAMKRAFRHRSRDGFGDRVVLLEQTGVDSEKLGLRLR